MDPQNLKFRKLQQHLNQQPVGFPSSKSGADIKVLQHIFSEKEAEIALALSYIPKTVEEIFPELSGLVETPEVLQTILDEMQVKGGLEGKREQGKKKYALVPLVVGMYELQLNRLHPEFIQDFKAYTREMGFGLEYLSTEIPQMRTIPIGKSVEVKHNVSPFDDVEKLLNHVAEPFVIVECICRKKREIEGKECKVTDRKETCMAVGPMAESVLETGVGRRINREEAIEIIDENQKEGLILQPSNTEDPEFICSCCGCCCGILNIHKSLPKPLDFWATNYQILLDTEKCSGCQLCVSHCQMDAIQPQGKKEPVSINLNHCLGCGVCVVACSKGALELIKKVGEIVPPKNRDVLYETIMANKKGKLGKVKLAGKLVADSLKTGNFSLFK